MVKYFLTLDTCGRIPASWENQHFDKIPPLKVRGGRGSYVKIVKSVNQAL
jgi:hypothetical protein